MIGKPFSKKLTSNSGAAMMSAYFYSSLYFELSNESVDYCRTFLILNGLSFIELSGRRVRTSSTALMNAFGAKVIEPSDVLEV